MAAKKETPQEKFDAGLASTRSTRCETRTNSHLEHTAHGTVKVTTTSKVDEK